MQRLKAPSSTTPGACRSPKLTLLAAGLLLAGSGAIAAPITSDVSIMGSVELSTSIGLSPYSDGDVTQSGDIRTTSGGTTATAGFTTSPGVADFVDDATTTVPAPMAAGLTDTGDGIGWSTALDALFESEYDFIVAFGIDLSNSSLVDTYTVTVRVDYSNNADADGFDAYADSKLDVELNAVDVLNSATLSDTFFGDELNGTLLGTFGDPVSDVGFLLFDVVLAPGGAANVGGTHEWEGAVFDPGLSHVGLSTDISIVDVVCTGGPCGVTPPPPPPPGVPVPGTLALLGLALPGLALRRRRRATGSVA